MQARTATLVLMATAAALAAPVPAPPNPYDLKVAANDTVASIAKTHCGRLPTSVITTSPGRTPAAAKAPP